MEEIDQRNKTDNYICVIASIILWLVAFTNGTGFGIAHNVYNRAMCLTLIVLAYYFFGTDKFRLINKNTFFAFSFFILHSFYTNYAFGHKYTSYIWLYLIILIFSIWELTEYQMRIIGISYGILGGIILYYANYTSVLSGWDGNSIAITPFISYTIFAASLSNLRDAKKNVPFVLYSLVYFYHLNTLGSRSTALFSIVLLLSLFHIIPLKSMLKDKKMIFILLLLPLIIAIIVVLVRNSPFIGTLDEWSFEHFDKPIFNGRDEMWNNGFEMFKEHALLGKGQLGYRWHNSAIDVLVGAGSVGYIIWISVIGSIWLKCSKWIEDYVSYGLLAAFVCCWLQQSVELGLVSPAGNPLFFVPLGLMLARVNTLEHSEELNDKNINYNSNL